jgi:DNA replication protein
MKQFGGFPRKMQFTPIPNLFFSGVMPEITEINELKVTLLIFQLVYVKKGYPRFVSFNELLGVISQDEEALRKALDSAATRGTVLHLILDNNGAKEDIYFVNNESEREAVEKIRSGEIKLDGFKATLPVISLEPVPDIFTLYEQNIGQLTPMIAEELKSAQKEYPEAWIMDAIKESAKHNKRNWSYISAILEKWFTEGKSDGTYQRDFKKTDPDKYIKGKYGHVVQR